MAVVYLHKRNDTNEVFYVGIGKTSKRAFNYNNRSKYWKRIVEKVGYIVDILVSETSWEDACKIEKLLIEKYGRKDLGLGNLVNMTDGGDGTLGAKFNLGKKRTPEQSQKQSERQLGKKASNESIKKQIISRTGSKRNDATKKNMSIAQIKTNQNAKGYVFDKRHSTYNSRININGKRIHLGCFKTPEQATEAYKEAKLKYHI
jgi:predicted phage tail protein